MHSRSLTSVFVLGFALLFSANSVYSLPINARSAGIGFSSVAAFELEGIYSVNPAALSLSKNVGILFQQDPRFPDEDHANYSYSDRLNTYGVHYPVTTKLSIGLHSQRFKQNRFLGENNYTQKTNSYFDVIGLSISGRIISNLRLGMSLNWMSSKTDVYFVSALSSLTAVEKNYTDSYYDMDLGALYQKQIYSSGTFVAKYSLGFTINNLGGNSKENELQAYRNTHLGTAVSIRWNTPLAILTSVEVTPTVEWHSYAKENYPSAGVLPNPFSAGLDAPMRSELDYTGWGVETRFADVIALRYGAYYSGGESEQTMGAGVTLPLHQWVSFLPLALNYDFGRFSTIGEEWAHIHTLSIEIIPEK